MDIARCYSQIELAGAFLYLSLNIWFDDIPTCEKPTIYLRQAMSYGFSPASQVLELGIFKYIFSQVSDKHLKIIIDMSRYADNLTVHGESRQELDQRCEKLMHLFSKYSLFFKNEIGPHTQI